MIDRTRSFFERSLGIEEVDLTAVFEEGQLLKRGADGKWRLAASDENPDGIALLNKSAVRYAPIVDEAVVLSGTDAVNLKRGNIQSGSVRVTSLDKSTVYVENTDYVVNYVNGQISRKSGGDIGDGETVLVSYMYQMTQAEIEERGVQLGNILDETIGSGRVVVGQGFCRVFTDKYDTSQAYAIGDRVYNKNGVFSTDSSGTTALNGRVIKVPTASDSMLGVEIIIPSF